MSSGAGRSADLISWDMIGRLFKLRPLRERYERKIFWTDVIGAWTDDLAVLALLDDVRGPSRGAAHHEQRREHRCRHTHQMIRHGGEPIQIRKHVLDLTHDRF